MKAAIVTLRLPSVRINDVGRLRIWELSSAEPRFGGISALSFEKGEFVSLTDSGTVIRWRLGGAALFEDLPAGPGPPQWKLYRDSEALTTASDGSRYVAFEQFHAVYRFDGEFTRLLGARPVPLRTWWRNWGVEALVMHRGGPLLFPENGGEVIQLARRGERRWPLEAAGQIADATRLGDGRVVIALRLAKPWGITNRLGWLEADGVGYRVRPWLDLPLGRWDNVEGIAAEALPAGGWRIWMVTDNDFRRRTLLASVDLPRSVEAKGAGDGP